MIILFFFLFSLVSCEYKELAKYGSVTVKPDTNVYLDITSFNKDEKINLEIIMNLYKHEQSSYSFLINQVEATSYADKECWDNLTNVTDGNSTSDSSEEYTFTWTEIKKEGKNFLFIIPPEPFDGYSDLGHEITIKNTGGISLVAIIGIIIGVIILIIVIGTTIYCCYHHKRTIHHSADDQPEGPMNTSVDASNLIQQPPNN